MPSENDAKQPPQELIDTCNKINKEWLINIKAHVEPKQHDGDFGIQWKISLIDDAIKETITRFICPEDITGHMVYLMTVIYRESYAKGLKEGAADTIKILTTRAAELVGINPKTILK